jgi:thymidylate synthase (FAD)
MSKSVTYRTGVEVELYNHMGSDFDIAMAAWVSTQGKDVGEGADLDERVAGLIRFLMRGRHGSPFEHNSMTFLVRAPIFVWREHHRHRIGFSYNEESGRYKELEPEFYLPAVGRGIKQVGKPGAYEYVPDERLALLTQDVFMKQAVSSYTAYRKLLANGVAREVARMYLPVSIYSSCFVTMNTRSLMSFLSLRTRRDHSHFPSFPMREIEMVAEGYEKHFYELFPVTHAAFCENGRVAP